MGPIGKFMKINKFFLLGILLLSGPAFAKSMLELPTVQSPVEYGDVLIERTSREKDVLPVVFSHWIHRVRYTCRVCHDELEFFMKTGETPIICDKGTMKGRYCASCHNGKVSFGPRGEEGDNCRRCHNADTSPNREKFSELRNRLPKAKFGNEIDWAKALNEGLIKPADSLSGNTRTIAHDKILTLRAEMSGIPPAVFPHKTHEQWLDCSNCHPDLFNIKKKTTKGLTMKSMLKGESCAVCHLRVAFPLDDCKLCHPSMRD